MAKKSTVRDAAGELLSEMIKDFSLKRAIAWLERKFPSFDTSKAQSLSVSENKNDKRFFSSARVLGFITELAESKNSNCNCPVLVAAIEMKNDLTERTSRQSQFNFARRALQEFVKSGAVGLNGVPSQGIFFFYDKDQYFRISLVSGKVEGRRFKFNEAKRQSFYINPERPNNVAKSRLQEPIRTYADLKEAFSVETLTKVDGEVTEWTLVDAIAQIKCDFDTPRESFTSDFWQFAAWEKNSDAPRGVYDALKRYKPKGIAIHGGVPDFVQAIQVIGKFRSKLSPELGCFADMVSEDIQSYGTIPLRTIRSLAQCGRFNDVAKSVAELTETLEALRELRGDDYLEPVRRRAALETIVVTIEKH